MIGKIRDSIRTALFQPMKFYFLVKYKIINLKDYILDFIHHFKILREANISLGKYHMTNGRFKDAALRFWLVDKIFAPKDDENLYWYSWANIMMKNYAAAIKIVNQDNSFDKIGVHNYISNMSSVSQIPEDIILFYESFTDEYRYKIYFGDKINLFEKFTSALIPFLPQKSWDEKNGDYSILEIGSKPFWTEEITNFLPDNYLIDSINFDKTSDKNTKDYNDKIEIYRNIKLANRYDFSEQKQKYDLIIAFDSLSHTTKLLDIFKNLKNLKTKEGILAMVLPKGNLTKLDPSMNHFLYTQNYITENLKLAEFEVSSITTIQIDKTCEYFIVIAR
jgi:hypothetical protein